MNDSYLTLEKPAQAEIKVKGSRFIGFAAPVSDFGAVHRILAERSKKYHGATHHCYAYILGPDDSQFRYHDDGEPAGTAGKPILDIIQGKGLMRVLCVVTRYFGGTKLGTGGLVRAYGRCAKDTLDATKIVERFHMQRIHIKFDYDLTGTVMSILSKHRASIQNKQYGEETAMEVAVRRSQLVHLIQMLQDGSGGKVDITKP